MYRERDKRAGHKDDGALPKSASDAKKKKKSMVQKHME